MNVSYLSTFLVTGNYFPDSTLQFTSLPLDPVHMAPGQVLGIRREAIRLPYHCDNQDQGQSIDPQESEKGDTIPSYQEEVKVQGESSSYAFTTNAGGRYQYAGMKSC